MAGRTPPVPNPDQRQGGPPTLQDYQEVDRCFRSVDHWRDPSLRCGRGAAPIWPKTIIGLEGPGSWRQQGDPRRGGGLRQGIDLNEIELQWFDRWLKGMDNGVKREPALRIFVMGDP